jgi:hypothetical protein
MKQIHVFPSGQLIPHFPKKEDTLECNRTLTRSSASKVEHEHS